MQNYNAKMNQLEIPNPWIMPSVAFSELDALPKEPGIYFAMSNGIVQYIGRSENLCRRWKQHHHHSEMQQFDDVNIAYMLCPVELTYEIERALIDWFSPPLNRVNPMRVWNDAGEFSASIPLPDRWEERSHQTVKTAGAYFGMAAEALQSIS